MHQRHPIRVDKSRALPAGSDRHTTGSTQLSFHKIYRQKRCYSNFDKGKEGYSSSLWKSDCGNTSRESNIALEPRYSAGHSGFKTTRKTDFKESIKSGSSSFSLSTGSGKSDRELPKRSFDRFSCNFTSGPEFDAPVAKKQKVEFCKSSTTQRTVSPDFEHSKQKLSLDETKWMYKNQHAKMSGPYGVKQLMEGLQSRFLQEDLPIYQVCEGKLCKPITLQQLMDDVQQSMRDSRKRHSNQSMHSQRFLQVSAEESSADDDDFPPGFGGRSSFFSRKSSCEYSPNAMPSVPGPRCSPHNFSSLGPDFGENDLSLPPGYESRAAIESQTSELCGTPRKHSMSVGATARREGVPVIHSSFEQLEPMVHDRVYSSWQCNSPHSIVGYSKQATKIGGEIPLNGHTAWAYAPAATTISCFEPQTFSQPTVCIGLPVRKSATQSWPIANNVPPDVSKAEPYSYTNAFILANSRLAPKEPISFHGPDPLSLILLELLAAVKRTYVSSVLSALIGEQLDCWLDANKHWMDTSISFDKGSPAKGACCISSRTEVHMEASASHIEASGSAEASTLHIAAAITTTSHPDILSEARDAQHSEGSCLVSHAASLGKSQRGSPTETRNDAYPCFPMEIADTMLLNNAEDNDLGVSERSPSCGKAENLFLGPDKVESRVSKDEACKLSSKPFNSLGDEPGQTFLISKEEMQQKSEEEVSHDYAINGRSQSSGNTSNAILPEARPPLAPRSKKENMKSVKQLMLITSKLRSARLKTSLLKKSGSKLLCSESPKVLDISQRSGTLASEHYDGCARTFVCGWSWKNRAQDSGHSVELCEIKNQSCKGRNLGVSSSMQALAHSAQTGSGPLESLRAAVDVSETTELTLSKPMSKRRLKVARSKIHKWGVFSAEAVEAGDFVIEYLGELVRSRIADIRERHYSKSGTGSGFVLRIDNENAVDATKRGGLARFINHSCDPNCYLEIVTVEGSKRVLIFAKRHIQAGEEVTYDYKSVHGLLNVPCSCGSLRCQGYST